MKDQKYREAHHCTGFFKTTLPGFYSVVKIFVHRTLLGRGGCELIQPVLHGILLALGLILPLGAQNVFVFNQGANQKMINALPVVITAGLCDTF